MVDAVDSEFSAAFPADVPDVVFSVAAVFLPLSDVVFVSAVSLSLETAAVFVVADLPDLPALPADASPLDAVAVAAFVELAVPAVE